MSALVGQVRAIVFDGSQPANFNLQAYRGQSFGMLLELTDTAGNAIDMSATSPAPWKAELFITDDFGGVTSLDVKSTTATAGGSLLTFPSTSGQVQIYVSATDMNTLPVAYYAFKLVVTDNNGVPYLMGVGLYYVNSGP